MSAQAKVTTPVQPGVNLLPPEVHQRRAARKLRGYLVLAIGLVVALAVGGVVWANGELSSAEDRLTAAKDENRRLRAEEAKYWEVPITLAELQNAKDAEFLAMWREILWEDYMLEITEVLPDDVEFEQFMISAPGSVEGDIAASHPLQGDAVAVIEFNGIVETRPDAAEWIDALNDIDGFSDAWVTVMDYSGTASEPESDDHYTVQSRVNLTSDAFSGRYIPDLGTQDGGEESDDETEEEAS